MRIIPRSVVLSGDLDITECARVRAALDCLQDRGIVDLREVRYLDSSALKELARLARRVGPHNVTLVVASPNIRKVLRIVAFEKLFTIVDAIRPAAPFVPAYEAHAESVHRARSSGCERHEMTMTQTPADMPST